ncbi:MAG: hypothetical protein OEM83_04555 [Gammaproteobacteria bacterium]|nr:hypothetical protein [Gammaproteobacteria bacterium]
MLKPRKRGKTALILALLLAPPVAYAVYFLLLFMLDTWRGDGLILHQYEFESRRKLAVQLLADARQALPVFYAAVFLLWAEIRLLSRLGEWGGMLLAALVGMLTGLVIAALFAGMTLGVIIPAAVAGLLMAIALSWATRPLQQLG